MNVAAEVYRVLLVSRSPESKSSLVTGLRQEGWAVEEARLDQGTPIAVDGYSFDIVIIDWVFPGGSSLEALRHIRAHNADVRIVMLAEEDDVLGRIRSFENGADDCMVRPVSPVELIARCRALLRRR